MEPVRNFFWVRDGDHGRLPDDEIEDSSGIRYLRAQDLKNGEIAAESPVFITQRYFETVKRSHIKPGYLLVSIMASIGSCSIVPSDYPPATANRAVGILAPKQQHPYLTAYLSYLLSTDLGRKLCDRMRKGGLQQRTNLADIEKLEFPIPPERVQSELVAAMEAARAARRAKLAEADALLGGLDSFLLDTLGLAPPPIDNRKLFTITADAIRQRLDPHFHLPQFAQIESLLSEAKAARLGDLVRFSHEQWKPEDHADSTFHYLEISQVNTQTGEARYEETPTADAPSRARMVVRDGDIIASLTRPHHGAIAQITASLDGCIASTGFAVLRDFKQDIVRDDYLWCVLRTQLCLRQMLQRSSGGNYPAITEAELAKVLVPVPSIDQQSIIAAEVRRRRDLARTLRAESETGWAEARRWFEEQLLGPQDAILDAGTGAT